MSYCKACGAYMPDWAEECPACGQARDAGKKRAAKKKDSATSAASSASAAASEPAGAGKESGEYRYTYKKASSKSEKSEKSEAEERWSSAGTGGKRRKSRDNGTFTYDGSRSRDGGTFTYNGRASGKQDGYDDDGYEYERPRTARDYEREYRTDAKRNKLLAALCYFGPMFILSWLLKPKSRFVRYHVNQGLVFFLMCVIINIFDFIPFMWLLNIFSVICFFCGISNALKGKRKPLPGIGEITLIN